MYFYPRSMSIIIIQLNIKNQYDIRGKSKEKKNKQEKKLILISTSLIKTTIYITIFRK
jgi:hypothetical protein